MPDTSPPPRLAPAARLAHTLGVYAEPLVSGRRVVVVGDSSQGVAERLLELGARVVHVYDGDTMRARGSAALAPRGVTVRDLPAPGVDFDVRDGAFDLAIVPDLGEIPEPAQLVLQLRRLLGAHGAVILAARNADGAADGRPGRSFDYYELYDLVSLQFAHVRMIAQLPFSGVAIAELGDVEDVQVSVDTQLAGPGGAPPVFIALAAQRDVRLDPYAIVQLPEGDDADERDVHVDVAIVIELEQTRLRFTEAMLRAELLTAQVDEQRVALAQLGARVEEAEAEEARNPRASELEAALIEQGNRLRDAEGRAGDNHVRAERLTHDIRKLDEELQRQRDRAFRLTRELEDEKKARTKADLELGMVRKNPELANARERISYLEEALVAAEEVANVLQGRVGELEMVATARGNQLALISVEIESLKIAADLGQAARLQIDELAQRAEEAERQARSLSVDARQGEVHAAELSSLEETLRERARALHALQMELTRREKMVQELVLALEEAAAGQMDVAAPAAAAAGPTAEMDSELRLTKEARERFARENAALREKLDALALEAARREGDVQTTSWRVAELEQQLATLQAAARPAGDVAPKDGAARAPMSPQLDAALEQIDVLKQALAQEHEARRQSASGEELTRARAELARQATLIEQLSRELDARDASVPGGRAAVAPTD